MSPAPPDLKSFCDIQFAAVIERRTDDILSHYVNSAETYVFVEGPRWSTRGFAKIAEGWKAYADAPLAVKSIETVEGPYGSISGNMGWVANIVELTVDASGDEKKVRFRGTFVLKRETDGNWRIEHEHFSQPVEDPYGIGDWLKDTN